MNRFSFAHRGLVSVAVAVALASTTAACSGEAITDTTSSAPTSPVSSDPQTDAGAGGACTMLSATATPVPIESVASPPPEPLGGDIVDGTYVLLRATLYTGNGGAVGLAGPSLSVTIRIAKGIAETVGDGRAQAATFATSGTTLTTTNTCPDHAVQQLGYTASGATIEAFIVEGKKTLVETFSRL